MGEVVKVNFNAEDIVRISSREVAEMMETRHDSLIRKIENISEDLVDHNFVVNSLWVENTYVASNGKSNKEYLISKDGCQFLAHKSTGTKGNIFTMKYMERFKQLEEENRMLKEAMNEKAQLLLQIYNGGQEGVVASKRLTEIEVEEATAPLIDKIDEQETIIDNVINDKGLFAIGTVGKVLKSYTSCMGSRKIFDYLRKEKILFNEEGAQKHNLPYDRYSQYFNIKYVDVEIGTYIKSQAKVYFTGKGLKWFLKRLIKDGKLEKSNMNEIQNQFA